MIYNHQSLQTFLNAELLLRQSKNPSYSLRAFARLLDLSPSRLSEFLSGKRSPTVAVATQIAEKLELSTDEYEYAVLLSQSKKLQPASEGNVDKSKFESLAPEQEYQALEDDTFRIIADWYHFAILEMSRISSFQPEATFIAQKLGISETEAKSALNRLLKLEILKICDDGKIIANASNITTTRDLASAAIRISHRQVLQKARDSLITNTVEERDISTMMMAIDTKKIPKAKDMIQRFRRKLCEYLESGTPNAVYCLNVALFGLESKPGKSGKSNLQVPDEGED